MPIELLLSEWLARFEQALENTLPALDQSPQRLHAAMRYAALGPGKRFRPLLVYATGTALGATIDRLHSPAVAVELIHAFSLVHDDLPAMDDDVLRRGRQTTHVAFDEATAILAGDALQTLAFSALTHAPFTAEVRIGLVGELANATGAAGMCGGQALDIAGTGQNLSLPELEHLHTLKTGALIRAAVRMGGLSAQANVSVMKALNTYADALGLAFQIRDDILDIESNAAQLGKTVGKDCAQGKSTYPALIGMECSKQLLEELADKMHAALTPLDARADALRHIAHFAATRAH